MVRVWIATLANFFFPGLGYLILGTKQILAIFWIAGAIGLTVVEFGIQGTAFYWPMFVSVLVFNTAFAVDAYRTGKELFGTPVAA